MAKRSIPTTERPGSGALTPAHRTAIGLWNHGLHVLDMQRGMSVEGQAELMERFIGLHTYAQAIMQTSGSFDFAWLKGRELAIERGVEENPPFMETASIIMPNIVMVQKLMIAYGDCAAADWLRAKAIREEGADAVARSRHLVTLTETEELYGRQPSVAADTVTLPR